MLEILSIVNIGVWKVSHSVTLFLVRTGFFALELVKDRLCIVVQVIGWSTVSQEESL